MSQFEQECKSKLLKDGYNICPKFLTYNQLNVIQQELDPWLKQITWNDTLANKGDKWLYHLGLCSPTLTQIILNESLLDFFEEIFGEPAIVAEFSLHHSTSANKELAYHSDRAGGMILYLFLTEMDDKNGQLCVIPGTQSRSEYFYIPQNEIEKVIDQEVSLNCNSGDAIFFDQDVWHRRKAGAPGRCVVKILYNAESRVDAAVDHLYRQSILSNLNERQLKAFGIQQPAFQREGYFRKVGRPFNKNDLATSFAYFRKFLNFSWGAIKNVDPYSKLKKHPQKFRNLEKEGQ